MSFIYFPTQKDVDFPNSFLRTFKMAENMHVVSNIGTRETKEKHNVCQIVCYNFDFAHNTLLQPYRSRIYASGRKEIITNTIVCHENNLKQLEF